MPKKKQQEITIIGAGIIGCFLAILFAKRGYTVHVCERASKNQIISSNTKRSFHLTFYDFGIHALKKVGLWNTIKHSLIKSQGSHVQMNQNPPVNRFVPVSKPQYIVQRGMLIRSLLIEAEKYASIIFHFNTTLLAINREKKVIIVQKNNTQKLQTIAYNVLFGADGVNSTVRTAIQKGQETAHKLEHASWMYKQLSLTKKQALILKLEPDAIYTWTRKNASLLGHPNQDGSFSFLLLLPKNAKDTFDTLTSEKTIRTFIKNNFTDFLPFLPTITSQILSNPVSRFTMITTYPWYYKDSIVIVGDAAHGFFPFYGQGVSAGFGDCLKLMELRNKYHENWEKIFFYYQKDLKPSMDQLAKLSKETLRLYSRSKKAQYPLIYNKFEEMLHTLFPNIFIAPIAPRVAGDPRRTADYVKEHKRQRKISNMLGIPLVIFATTTLIGLYEQTGRVVTRGLRGVKQAF